MRTLTDETFREGVRDGGTVLVEFWATWCPPCRMIEPVLEEIDREVDGLTVYKIDTDANPLTTRDQRVMANPTLQVWRDGELVAEAVGARPKAQLLAWLEPHL
ncbi:thioredoxin family protein [Actinosynnema sp. NPDC020468]|uniref:thioredoxin family protein n=1 Tax=Actinosynnema sp. NPDC020468 TaxID=3154488 RepID=UPI0033E8AAAE